MNWKTIAFVALVLVVCASAWAQANAIFYTFTPLTDQCGGGAPLPATCQAVIYWDSNNNGPDPSDAPVPLGDCPQCCVQNAWNLNGNDYLGMPGTFFTDPAFTPAGAVALPQRYFFRVACQDVIWTSPTSLVNYGYSEHDISQGWTCEVAAPDTCAMPIEPNLWDFEWLPEDHRRRVHHECIWLCADVAKTFHVAGIEDLWGVRWAFATLGGGCGTETNCDTETPGQAAQPLWENGQTTVNFTEFWQGSTFTLSSPVDGWACLYVDIFLPVEQGTFDAVSGDSEVRLQWNTLSETGVERFELMRSSSLIPDYEPVASIPAENSSSGAQYGFVDREVTNGVTYTYTLAVVNLDGSRQEWGNEVNATPHAEIVSEFALHQNFPNPFNPETRIAFDLAAEANVTLEVFNISGQVVVTLMNGAMDAGSHSVAFSGSALSAGVYFYTLRADGFTATKKMLLLK